MPPLELCNIRILTAIPILLSAVLAIYARSWMAGGALGISITTSLNTFELAAYTV